MMPDYEYHGLMARYWDLLRGDTSNWPDRFFYLKVIKKYGQPVLDVGCGSGRLILDYLSQGIDIDGVDVSPEMIALCERNAARMNLLPRAPQPEHGGIIPAAQVQNNPCPLQFHSTAVGTGTAPTSHETLS
jgi:SAM-dependent methyltransferase